MQSEARFRKEYVLVPGDQVEILIRRVPEVSRKVTIRSDGFISLSMLDEVSAAGLTPRELDAKLTGLFSARVVDPLNLPFEFFFWQGVRFVQPGCTIEAAEVVEPPVLAGADLAKVTAQLHKPGIPLSFHALLPGQDHLDLGQHEQRPATVQLRWS